MMTNNTLQLDNLQKLQILLLDGHKSASNITHKLKELGGNMQDGLRMIENIGFADGVKKGAVKGLQHGYIRGFNDGKEIGFSDGLNKGIVYGVAGTFVSLAVGGTTYYLVCKKKNVNKIPGDNKEIIAEDNSCIKDCNQEVEMIIEERKELDSNDLC